MDETSSLRGGMTMKAYRWLFAFLLAFVLSGCAKGGTHLIPIRYEPQRDFASLSARIGPTLGLVDFRDERPDPLYIGRHTPYEGTPSYFKSDPFPLSQAMMESISRTLSRFGVKTLSIPSWDGKPESLKGIEADSVLRVEIRRFWTEGRAAAFRTHAKTSVHLVIHLGVKREGKVFTRNVEVEKEGTWARLTPQRVEALVNQALAEILDAFFANPY
ncbi:MAG: hypothetical protein N3G78_05445 [Desulfobacterota bacterium]|nr:hypothetical protein [Thermodesulfobacteriota bacterium]